MGATSPYGMIDWSNWLHCSRSLSLCLSSTHSGKERDKIVLPLSFLCLFVDYCFSDNSQLSVVNYLAVFYCLLIVPCSFLNPAEKPGLVWGSRWRGADQLSFNVRSCQIASETRSWSLFSQFMPHSLHQSIYRMRGLDAQLRGEWAT